MRAKTELEFLRKFGRTTLIGMAGMAGVILLTRLAGSPGNKVEEYFAFGFTLATLMFGSYMFCAVKILITEVEVLQGRVETLEVEELLARVDEARDEELQESKLPDVDG